MNQPDIGDKCMDSALYLKFNTQAVLKITTKNRLGKEGGGKRRSLSSHRAVPGVHPSRHPRTGLRGGGGRVTPGNKTEVKTSS